MNWVSGGRTKARLLAKRTADTAFFRGDSTQSQLHNSGQKLNADGNHQLASNETTASASAPAAHGLAPSLPPVAAQHLVTAVGGPSVRHCGKPSPPSLDLAALGAQSLSAVTSAASSAIRLEMRAAAAAASPSSSSAPPQQKAYPGTRHVPGRPIPRPSSVAKRVPEKGGGISGAAASIPPQMKVELVRSMIRGPKKMGALLLLPEK